MKNRKMIEEMKAKLLEEKEQLESSLKEFADPDPKLKGDFVTRFPDFVEQDSEKSESADEVEEYGDKLPVEHRLELRLRDVNDALKKIEEGTYGVCGNCRQDIPVERLQANPAARICLDCRK